MTDLTLEEQVARMEKTTAILEGLPASFSQPNGWKLKELLLHIWSWDVELIRACQAKKANALEDFQFSHQKEGIEVDDWNVRKIREKEDLSLDEVKQLFQKTRSEFINECKSLLSIPETVTDEKSYFHHEDIFAIWQHDLHHLKLGGREVQF